MYKMQKEIQANKVSAQEAKKETAQTAQAVERSKMDTKADLMKMVEQRLQTQPSQNSPQNLLSEEMQMRPFKIPLVRQGKHQLVAPHTHESMVFKYPTVGLPTPGVPFNDLQVSSLEITKFDDTVN